MSINDSLRKAIEEVYRAFQDVPKPSKIEGCPCCIEGKEVDVLLRKPIREITPKELSAYSSSVFLTVGSQKDFHYLVPRILEIAVTDLGWWPDPEVSLGKLKSAEWIDWRKDRHDAVLNFLETAFQEFVIENPLDADSWLCGIVRAGIPLTSLISQIERSPTSLISIYEVHSSSLLKGRTSNGFWDDIPVEREILKSWLCSEETSVKIQLAYEAKYA